jgi:hypothetical protein
LVNNPANTSQPQNFQCGYDSDIFNDLSTRIQYQDPQSVDCQNLSTNSVMSQSEDPHILVSNMKSFSSARRGEAESFEPQSVPELSFSSPASDLLSPQPATPEIDLQSKLALVTRAAERVDFQLPPNNNNWLGNDRVTEFPSEAFASNNSNDSLNITNDNSITQASEDQRRMHGLFNGVPNFPKSPSNFATGNPFSESNMAKSTVGCPQGQSLGSSVNHYSQVNMILDDHEIAHLGSGSVYPPASSSIFISQAPTSTPASQFAAGQAIGFARSDTVSIGARNAFISRTGSSQSENRYSKEFGGQFSPNIPSVTPLQNTISHNHSREPLSLTNASLSYRQAEQNSNLVRTQSTPSNAGLLASHGQSNQDLNHNRFTPIQSRFRQNHLEFNQRSDKSQALPHGTGFSEGQLASIYEQQAGQDSHARQGIRHNQMHGQFHQKMPIRDVGSVRDGSNQSWNQQRSVQNFEPPQNNFSPPSKQSDRGMTSFAEIQKQIDDSLMRGLPLPTFTSTTPPVAVMTDDATVTARTQARNPKLRVQKAPLASNAIQQSGQATGNTQWAPTIEIGNTPGTYSGDNTTFPSLKKTLKRTRAVANLEEIDPDVAMVNHLYNIKDTRQRPVELQPGIQTPGMISISHIPINPTVQYYIDRLSQQNLSVTTTRTTKAGAVKRSAPKRKKITLDNIKWEYCHEVVTPQSSLKTAVGHSAYNIHHNPLIGKNIWTPMEDHDGWSYEPHETTSSFMMFFNSSSYTPEERIFLYTDVGIWREEFGETGRFDEEDIDRMVANGWSFDEDRDIIIH